MTNEPTIDLITRPKGDKDDIDQLVTHQRYYVSTVAQFAMGLMNMGMLQPCVPDGEDSSGTRQYRMLTEREVVNRAVLIAEMAFGAFQERGWMAKAPPLADMRRLTKSQLGFHATTNDEAA